MLSGGSSTEYAGETARYDVRFSMGLPSTSADVKTIQSKIDSAACRRCSGVAVGGRSNRLSWFVAGKSSALPTGTVISRVAVGSTRGHVRNHTGPDCPSPASAPVGSSDGESTVAVAQY